MYFLIAGSALFFAVHLYSAFRTRTPGRDRRGRMGHFRFMGAYSVIALAGFAMMIWGYGLARPSAQVFNPPAWGASITLLLMFPALILLASCYMPFGHIKEKVGHPMLLATTLWSAGHLFANGEQNSLILFGSFLAFSLIDLLAVQGRPKPIKKPDITGDYLSVAAGIVLYGIVIAAHGLVIGVPVIAS